MMLGAADFAHPKGAFKKELDRAQCLPSTLCHTKTNKPNNNKKYVRTAHPSARRSGCWHNAESQQLGEGHNAQAEWLTDGWTD